MGIPFNWIVDLLILYFYPYSFVIKSDFKVFI
jgi:hypothetical protein